MKTLRIVLLAVVAVAAGLVASAHAQTLLLTLDTMFPQQGGNLGFSVAVGEVDGDGKADIAVGAYSEEVDGIPYQGRAYVFSGADASLLFTLDTPNPQSSAYFGVSVAVGDVNGDGKGDIAVGAHYEDVGGNDVQGRAYVFSGADGSLLFTLDTPNPQTWALFGSRVAVGDVNGDGKGDIAVTAYAEDVGGNANQGRAYVFSGADGSLLLTLDTPNPQSNADFGRSVAVGDVNGDTKVDIAVGAAQENVGGNSSQGRAYVFSGADGSLLLTLDSPNPQAQASLGWSVAVGEVDGDGKADIAVGTWSEDVGGNANQGRAYVFSGADGSPLLTLDTPNPAAGAFFGSSVAVGDVNGDGKGDIAVGAHLEDVGGNDSQGRTYVLSGVDGSPLFTLDTPNPAAHARFGYSVAAGDVNGDGKADIAVGARTEDVEGKPQQGRAYVFSGADGSLLFTLDTPNPPPGNRFGWSVAIGDVNDDGKADIAVAEPGERGAQVYSGADGSPLFNVYSPNWPEPFGDSVAVGDVNDDGKADIAVGAYKEDVGGNEDQGRAYVFSGVDGSLLLTLDTPNPEARAYFGYWVAQGDVNGDGKADIATGAFREDVGGNEDQGRAYVFSGADGSLLLTLDTPNPQAGVHFGANLAVGEVNGDGKADIAVGAVLEDVGGNDAQGRAYVFSGADGSLLLTLDTPNPEIEAFFGGSLAVGDVNGDAKGDIAVGAQGEDVEGNAKAGRAYVFSGADGSLLLTLASPNPQEWTLFGGSVAVGEVNGDGKGDIAVGASEENVGANNDQGQAYVFSGANGSLLFSLDTPNPQASGRFGKSVSVGDVNGDGRGDVAVGAPGEDWGGSGWPYTNHGRAYVFSSSAPAPVGGTAELPDISGSSGHNYIALTGLVAAALAALTGGAWYARRRRLG